MILLGLATSCTTWCYNSKLKKYIISRKLPLNMRAKSLFLKKLWCIPLCKNWPYSLICYANKKLVFQWGPGTFQRHSHQWLTHEKWEKINTYQAIQNSTSILPQKLVNDNYILSGFTMECFYCFHFYFKLWLFCTSNSFLNSSLIVRH